MKIHPMEAEVFHIDRQTDRHKRDEASSRFLQFCERS
jgi:hypothetical protein